MSEVTEQRRKDFETASMIAQIRLERVEALAERDNARKEIQRLKNLIGEYASDILDYEGIYYTDNKEIIALGDKWDREHECRKMQLDEDREEEADK